MAAGLSSAAFGVGGCRLLPHTRAVRLMAAFVGSIGKVWEVLGDFGSIAAHCSNIVHGGKRRKTAATVCVGNRHYPAYSLQERSVNRLQRALPASQYLPNPPKSSQFYRAASRRAHHDSISYAAIRICRPFRAELLSGTLPGAGRTFSPPAPGLYSRGTFSPFALSGL